VNVTVPEMAVVRVSLKLSRKDPSSVRTCPRTFRLPPESVCRGRLPPGPSLGSGAYEVDSSVSVEPESREKTTTEVPPKEGLVPDTAQVTTTVVDLDRGNVATSDDAVAVNWDVEALPPTAVVSSVGSTSEIVNWSVGVVPVTVPVTWTTTDTSRAPPARKTYDPPAMTVELRRTCSRLI
jgi:hypothetical protein